MFDGLVEDCCNSSALALELQQSCTIPWIWCLTLVAQMDWSNGWYSLKQKPSFLEGRSISSHVLRRIVPTHWPAWRRKYYGKMIGNKMLSFRPLLQKVGLIRTRDSLRQWMNWWNMFPIQMQFKREYHGKVGKMSESNPTLVINSLIPGRCACNLKSIIFKLISRRDILSISCNTAPRWWLVNNGKCNDLVPPSDKEPLPNLVPPSDKEPLRNLMLNQIYVTI